MEDRGFLLPTRGAALRGSDDAAFELGFSSSLGGPGSHLEWIGREMVGGTS